MLKHKQRMEWETSGITRCFAFLASHIASMLGLTLWFLVLYRKRLDRNRRREAVEEKPTSVDRSSKELKREDLVDYDDLRYCHSSAVIR